VRKQIWLHEIVNYDGAMLERGFEFIDYIETRTYIYDPEIDMTIKESENYSDGPPKHKYMYSTENLTFVGYL
jgi:hypothetical protein